MARLKNDGRGRMGGRTKGTPNKVTSELKEWIALLINNGRDEFKADLTRLSPFERVKVYIGLMNYILPKQQAVSAETEAQTGTGLTIIVESKEDEILFQKALERLNE